MLTEQADNVQRMSHERNHPCCHAPQGGFILKEIAILTLVVSPCLPPTDDFTGVSDMGATTGGLHLDRMKQACHVPPALIDGVKDLTISLVIRPKNGSLGTI